jgi:hypothetical protein
MQASTTAQLSSVACCGETTRAHILSVSIALQRITQGIAITAESASSPSAYRFSPSARKRIGRKIFHQSVIARILVKAMPSVFGYSMVTGISTTR